jgi:hypothetical protein
MSEQIYHNAELEHYYNYDQLFFRSCGVALGKVMSKTIRWINYFEDKKIRVLCPFYYQYLQENFVIDTFVDDILGERIELDTTQRPRGIIRMTNFSPVSTEFANPNQYLSQKVNVNNNLRNIISKVRAIPININYDIEIHVASQGDVEKAYKKILYSLHNWKFFRFDYFGLPIDANFELPDGSSIENIAPDSIDFNQTDRFPTIKYSLEVRTYFPIFKVDSDDLQVCDNDDELNWDLIDVPKPELDYIETVKKYKNITEDKEKIDSVLKPDSNGQIGGSLEEIEEVLAGPNKNISWDEAFISRVFWKSYIYESSKRDNSSSTRTNVGENDFYKDLTNKMKKRP